MKTIIQAGLSRSMYLNACGRVLNKQRLWQHFFLLSFTAAETPFCPGTCWSWWRILCEWTTSSSTGRNVTYFNSGGWCRGVGSEGSRSRRWLVQPGPRPPHHKPAPSTFLKQISSSFWNKYVIFQNFLSLFTVRITLFSCSCLPSNELQFFPVNSPSCGWIYFGLIDFNNFKCH